MKISWIPALMYSFVCFRSLSACVQTSSGLINGVFEYYENTTLEVYLGIPFATPPVGNLRFRRTMPVQPWTAPLIADSYPPACIQYYPYKYPWVDWKPGQSEDCLYLNIWAPRNSNNGVMAVMFWIFGGGFSSGSNRLETYKGKILAAEGDVVVVTVNYRLGAFGFLTTPSEEAPGNMALYDVLEALRWVKRNIHAFGGNPERITVFGFSGGALIAGLLCISPLATGLFNRVILQSGAPIRLNEDSFYNDNLELGERLAAALGCSETDNSLTQDPVDVIQCLRNKDAHLLAYTTESLNPGAVVTFNYIAGDDFVPKNPLSKVLSLQLHNVDVLIGNVQDEGSFKITSNMVEIFGPFGEKNPQINKSFGSDIIRKMFSNFPATPEVVVEQYLGGLNENDYDEVRRQVYHSYGDYALICTDVYFAESYARKGSSVYYYYFNHRPSVTPWAHWMGVAHASEVPFVFGLPVEYTASYTIPERELSKKMISLWSNFAKNGVPSQSWPKFSKERHYVVTFELPTNENSQLSSHFEKCEFFRPYFVFP